MKTTPLSQALTSADKPQVTPLTVFKLARRWWLECRRISIGDLASAVGVSRVTLYRWVGSREQLIEEVLWSFAGPAFEKAAKSSPDVGVPHVVETYRRFMTDLVGCEPLLRFIEENPLEAIRYQTNNPVGAHGRLIKAAEAQLIEQKNLGHLELAAPAFKLAEMIIWSNGSLLSSAIIGRHDPHPAVEQACTIDRLLLKGETKG